MLFWHLFVHVYGLLYLADVCSTQILIKQVCFCSIKVFALFGIVCLKISCLNWVICLLREAYYQMRMSEQKTELESLMQERKKLLSLQQELQRLHDTIPQVGHCMENCKLPLKRRQIFSTSATFIMLTLTLYPWNMLLFFVTSVVTPLSQLAFLTTCGI